MDPEKYEDILYNNRILRWSARILGTLEAGLSLYIIYGEFMEEIKNNSPSPLTTLINGQYFLAITLSIALIGLIIAYWKEGLGGGISLVCLLVLFISAADFHMTFILGMGMISIPPLLYVAWWLRVYLAVRKAKAEEGMIGSNTSS